MARVVAAFVASAVALSATTAAAYRTAQELPDLMTDEPVAWRDAYARFWLRSEGAPPIPISAVERAVVDGFSVWNEPTCSALVLEYGGVTAASASPGDGYNTVMWVSDWAQRGFSSDVGATTDITFSRSASGSSWIITDADVLLNARHYQWTTGDSTSGARDIQAVIAHEAGHLAGLLHPCTTDGSEPADGCDVTDESSAMYPLSVGPSQRELAADDIAGLCSVYPTASCVETGCPSGDICVEHRCVPDCEAGGCMSVTPCRSVDDCESGELCSGGTCFVPSRMVGDPCGSDDECSLAACHVDGYCTSTCASSEQCDPGWDCSLDIGICTSTRGLLGDPCASGRECATGLCVLDASSGMCTRPCDTGHLCPSSLRCERVNGDDVCVAPLATAGCTSVPGSARLSMAAHSWLLLLIFVGYLRKRGGRNAP